MSSWGNIEPDTKMRNIGGGYGWFQFHSLQLKTKVCKNVKTSFLPLKKRCDYFGETIRADYWIYACLYWSFVSGLL